MIKNIVFSKFRLREIETSYQKLNIRLMARAAKALSLHLIKIIEREKIDYDKPILIFAGRGNNGGDALEMAAVLLKYKKKRLPKILLCDVANTSENLTSEDYQAAKQKFITAGGKTISFSKTQASNKKYALIVDGVFGIGFIANRKNKSQTKNNNSPVEFQAIQLINKIKFHQNIKVVAIDIASGVDSESGNLKDNNINSGVFADYTISLISHKAGIFMNIAPSYSGRVVLDTLKVDKEHIYLYDITTVNKDCFILNSSELWLNYLPIRLSNYHKGMAGDVVVIGGVSPMSGAGQLVAHSAIAMGCGRVYWKNDSSNIPEVINSEPDFDLIKTKNTSVVIGPGLGQSLEAKSALTTILDKTLPLIIDADAINLIADNHSLQKKLKERKSITIFTPHPLEAARLLQTTVVDIQNNRIQSALKISKKYNVYVVLKGCGTVMVDKQTGQVYIQKGCSCALSTAGSGDVLAGALASLLAQSLANNYQQNIKIIHIILMAVGIHLLSGKYLEAQKLARGSLASEIVRAMRIIYNEFEQKSKCCDIFRHSDL